jgi:hypothetical protein
MILNIDFDSTCVVDAFPGIGQNIGAVPVLKELVNQGHKLILWTVRSNRIDPESSTGTIKVSYLDDAVQWFNQQQIPLYGVNKNPDQYKFSSSPKSYAHFTIDDSCLGCPLFKVDGIEKPFVNWWAMVEILIRRGILDPSKNPDLGAQLSEDCQINFSTTKFSFYEH